MKHIVNKLRFEIGCVNEGHAFQIQHNMSAIQDQIAETIDKVCSEASLNSESILIDKLELDLGSFSSHTFGTDFLTVFKRSLELKLTKRLALVSLEERTSSINISMTGMWQHFLLTGTLPWWADPSDIEDALSFPALIAQQPEQWRAFFLENLTTQHVWKRVVLQFTSADKRSILSLFSELVNAFTRVETWSKMIMRSKTQRDPAFTGIDPDIIEKRISDFVLMNAGIIFSESENILLRSFVDTHADILDETESVEWLLNSIDETDRYLNTEYDNVVVPGDFDKAHAIDIGDNEEHYAIRHAGLVLLTPFLKDLFINLKLYDGGKWKDEIAQYKAIHLLRFLATGEEGSHEYNCVLEKILCNVELYEPIPRDILLTDHEKNECGELLVSVVEYWTVLKNTSPMALRENFIKRDGLLRKQGNNWFLQVERKTLDVLLDSIPWGYSTITLPWNKKLLFVEW